MTKQERAQAHAHEALCDGIQTTAFIKGFKLQKEVAKLLGISQQYYSDMMSGRKNWSPEKLVTLADKLGVGGAEWQTLGARAAGWRV